MGKHNGKARSGGLKVGVALANRARQDGKSANPRQGFLHTTDPGSKPAITSVLETNDLNELMSMAELAGREFAGEKENVIVISTGSTTSAADRERSSQARREAQLRNEHRLSIPRRPEWGPETTAEELDRHERESFLDWRRGLARLEEDEGLVLTPFEKNLEVWRQLWRVLERSDIVVQVLDARDPLRYRSEDLEHYCREVDASKATVLLLNKADLLPEDARLAWADHFDGQGVDYVFWSAKAAAEQQAEGHPEPTVRSDREGEDRAAVLGTDELLDYLTARAQQASPERLSDDSEAAAASKVTVGLTGYPNVGKSSTINALFGSKKTAVAATPGKTKHFQTLHVTEALILCDCPGLVLPKYADSKAEMVAAGVIPIDRLTDVRGPVEVVARRIGRQQLNRVYALQLPPPAPHEDPHRPPTAVELLRSFAMSRNWVAAGSLPDETRAGRHILKDYCAGKLRYCELPPGVPEDAVALAAPDSELHLERQPAEHQEGNAEAAEASGRTVSAADESMNAHPEGASAEPSGRLDHLQLTDADVELLSSMEAGQGNPAMKKRAPHKFHKKPVRTKGTRGKAEDDGTAYDGSAMIKGRRGGVVRV